MTKPTDPTGSTLARQGLSDYSSLAYTPPAWPGHSTYHVKGLGYRSFFDDCERTVPGGKAAMLAAIEQPELREFLEQEFLAATWFDVFPLPLARQVTARMARVPFAKHVRDAMRFTAQRDAQSVYRTLLMKRPSIKALLEALDVVAKQYLSFSPLVRPEQPEPTVRVVFRDGMPKVLVPWVESFTRGYTSTILEVAGARNVRNQFTTLPEPAKDGIELVTLRVETSWAEE